MIQVKCKSEEILEGVVNLINEFPEKLHHSIDREKLSIEIDTTEEYFLYSGLCVRSCWNEKEVYLHETVK